jgi:hypothetical protein
MKFTITENSLAMAETISTSKTPASVITLALTNKRGITVSVPNKLGTIISSLQDSYQTAASASFTAASSEMYASSPSISAWKLDEEAVTTQNTAGAQFNDAIGTFPHVFNSATDAAGLLFGLGCAASAYFSSMPWCVLGQGKYKWINTATNIENYDTKLWADITGTNTVEICNDNDATCTAVTTYATEYAAMSAGAEKNRANCIFRHYTFFKGMLDCAMSKMNSLMKADPGCMAADYTANRYGCLCRRRTRYAIAAKVEEPEISGRSAEAISDDPYGDCDPCSHSCRNEGSQACGPCDEECYNSGFFDDFFDGAVLTDYGFR